MVFPWMFDDFAALRPLKEAAELLAAKSDWRPLYNVSVLQQNKIPTAACVYAGESACMATSLQMHS